MRFSLNRAGIIRFLVAGMAVVVVAHVVTQTISLLTGRDVMMGFIPLFNMNAEANIPSLFSTLLLLIASGLLLANASLYRAGEQWFVKYWIFLAAIFGFLAIDELSALHERWTGPMRGAFGAEGLLYFAWVIPYAVILLVIGVLLLRFLLRLDRKIARGFVVAGVVYISGAVGMEMLGGLEAFSSGQSTVTFVLLSTVEEIMEISGVILFIDYILRDIFTRTDGLGISVAG